MHDEKLLTEKETAALLGVSVSTLRRIRATGPTPGAMSPLPYVRTGRLVRYQRCDVMAYIRAHLVGNGGADA